MARSKKHSLVTSKEIDGLVKALDGWMKKPAKKEFLASNAKIARALESCDVSTATRLIMSQKNLTPLDFRLRFSWAGNGWVFTQGAHSGPRAPSIFRVAARYQSAELFDALTKLVYKFGKGDDYMVYSFLREAAMGWAQDNYVWKLITDKACAIARWIPVDQNAHSSFVGKGVQYLIKQGHDEEAWVLMVNGFDRPTTPAPSRFSLDTARLAIENKCHKVIAAYEKYLKANQWRLSYLHIWSDMQDGGGEFIAWLLGCGWEPCFDLEPVDAILKAAAKLEAAGATEPARWFTEVAQQKIACGIAAELEKT